MKSGLLFFALLLTATFAQAQHSARHATLMESSQGFLMSGSGGGGGEIGSAGSALTYEAPRDLKVSYLTNDGPFVPTSYMNYEDALALGRQQVAAAQESAKSQVNISLGEIARAYRSVRVSTLQLDAKSVQDSNGRLEVCPTSGNCHRL